MLETLEITGQINPEARLRGIYEIVVYKSDLQISGTFKNISVESLNIDSNNILWGNVVITMGISDLRGVENQIILHRNDDEILFDPGTLSQNIISGGVSAKLPVIFNTDTRECNFAINLQLKSSQQLYFVPTG